MPWNVPDDNHSSRNNKQIIIDEGRHNNSWTQMHFGHTYFEYLSHLLGLFENTVLPQCHTKPNTESLTSAAENSYKIYSAWTPHTLARLSYTQLFG